ncbi:hypothetical protein [Devosia sp. 1566]|uniref:hypothetical protein n=1 Tax=Devosia sp. 1566 TaxID=2499144 RepID=UPI000FD70CFB|nr:hypothetical protein [Devosia sp. 1566]
MTTDCTGRIASRSEQTIAAYRQRVHDLRLMAEREDRAGGDMLELTGWFCAQDERWSPSTVRQYRAAILMALETLPFHPTARTLLVERLRRGPLPTNSGPRKTSAKKRKSLPIAQFTRLEQFLHDSGRSDDKLIRGFLVFGAALFLRPVEYLNARVEGMMLMVQNAKATNGRGNGEERARDLQSMGKKAIAALVKFVERLRTAVQEAGAWKKLHNRLASRLARICKCLGIARVSLYTLRHVGMATAKSWMAPEEVAASAGHASVHTAMTHYAKRRTGWVGLRLAGRPSPASVARVRGAAQVFRPSGQTMCQWK